MGLKENRINGIIDNSKEKNGKRLYGSSLIVKNPSIIGSASGEVMAVVKGGQYQNEIESQLLELNKNVYIINWKIDNKTIEIKRLVQLKNILWWRLIWELAMIK